MIRSTLFFILLWSCIHFAQVKNNEPVATINDQKISALEFKLRFELSPYISEKYDQYQPDSLKLDFLYSLIAEKLWAIEAIKSGYSQAQEFRFFFSPVKDILLRDALFKEAIEKKVVVSDNDIMKGIEKFSSKLSVQIISSVDSVIIQRIFKQLSASSKPDSLIKNDNTIKNITSAKEIELGTLKDEKIEDLVFSLKTGEFTKPFRHESVWVIFYLENKTSGGVDLNDQKIISEIKKRIKNRRLETLYISYTDSLFRGRNFQVNKENFYTAAEEIVKLLQSTREYGQKEYFIEESEYNQILNSLGDYNKNKNLVTVDKYNITIFDLISRLAFDQFKFTSLEKEKIISSLDNRMGRYIQQQMLVNEAIKRGLDNLPDVKEDLKTWEDHYYSHMYKTSFKDSVKISDDDLKDYYVKKVNAGELKLLNLAMVSTADLNIIGDILDRIKTGEDFISIAAEYGKTDSLTDETGTTGLISSMQLGELGNIAIKLKEGEVYGPYRRGNLYSVVQVLEIKNSSDSLSAGFANVREGIRSELFYKKMNEILLKKTVEFVSGNKIQINTDVLNRITLNMIPMFVHRVMGFGGRIAGVPLTTPFSNWVEEIPSEKILP
jgi:parvulin-like peptidyl-prolyl isomerase